MCGRYAIYGPVSRGSRDRLEFLGREIAFGPRYNAAPAQPLPVYRVHPARGPELVLLRWGLVPYWAKEPAIGARLINARAESLAAKPAFRAPFRRRRCLVPMAGFYEWRSAGGRRLPYFVRLAESPLFAAAGLYERWEGGEGEAPIESYTIITVAANERIRPIHERMPAILPEREYEAWLDPRNENPAALGALLRPYPAAETLVHPVSRRVNDVSNDGPELVAPQPENAGAAGGA